MPLYVDGRNVQQVCDAQLGPHDRELCSAGADAAKLRTLKLMMTLRLKQPLAFSAEFGSGGVTAKIVPKNFIYGCGILQHGYL